MNGLGSEGGAGVREYGVWWGVHGSGQRSAVRWRAAVGLARHLSRLWCRVASVLGVTVTGVAMGAIRQTSW